MEWLAAYFGFQTRQQYMRVGKVPGETERSSKQTEGNHDNLVSGTHQAPSHWKPQWRNVQILTKKTWEGKGGLGAKTARKGFKQHEENDWPQQKCYRAVKAQDNTILYTIIDGDR